MKAWLAGILWWVAGLAYGQQSAPPPAPTTPPMTVRVHQEPPGALVQGETARIVVDMLTPDYFIDAPVLPAVHVDGAYLALSDETPGHLVETVDGVTWTGVSRTYLVTPLMSGDVEIPSFEITAHVGAKRAQVTAQTQPLTLHVQELALPEGVKVALIANSVKITQTITPDHGGLRVGDSVTRLVEITADGAPAMMVPPTEFAKVRGLALYASPPATRDVIGNQGGFVGGSRIDVANYVIQHRGRYTLPPITLRWMDSRTHTWQQSSVPAVSFHAWWGAPTKPRFSLPQQGVMPRLLEWLSSDAGIAVLVLALMVWLTWRYRDKVVHAWKQLKAWQSRRRHSEAKAFARVKRQRHTTSTGALFMAVDSWIRRAVEEGAPPTMDAWCARFGDQALRQQWTSLQDAMYGKAASAWSASPFVEALVLARRQWLKARHTRHRTAALPPLNPA